MRCALLNFQSACLTQRKMIARVPDILYDPQGVTGTTMPDGGSDAGVAIDVAVEHLVCAQRVHKGWFVPGTGAQCRRLSVESGPRSRRSASGVSLVGVVSRHYLLSGSDVAKGHCVHRLQLARGFGIADRPDGVSSRSQSRSSAGRRRVSCREQLHRWFSSLCGQHSARQ